ncbi:putative acetyltransferase [Tieghemostelium lacteum]|uniref:Putative acetyltransferase n=1 Tax=Tieghemostelium lacteum TaxID=361077 RepID=A0A151Z770_TIELA|nr:putative acetyltransferase [Tieghemostelium lacteum]|eukprot:KYQ89777.1 putative acetyltransferase [Tieghemostelium lacteum]
MTTIINEQESTIIDHNNNNKPVEKTKVSKLTKEGLIRNGIHYKPYEGETQIQMIMDLIDKDLPEPYTIFTYRFFLNNNPELCILAFQEDQLVGVIISKKQNHRNLERGYIGMIVVDKEYRRKKIGKLILEDKK